MMKLSISSPHPLARVQREALHSRNSLSNMPSPSYLNDEFKSPEQGEGHASPGPISYRRSLPIDRHISSSSTVSECIIYKQWIHVADFFGPLHVIYDCLLDSSGDAYRLPFECIAQCHWQF